jgi:hypothetical protein
MAPLLLERQWFDGCSSGIEIFNLIIIVAGLLHHFTACHTPRLSLVALATRKIYPHRIRLAMPENERSIQWGSSVEAVRTVLDGITADDVIEEVLQTVEVPL